MTNENMVLIFKNGGILEYLTMDVHWPVYTACMWSLFALLHALLRITVEL